MSKEVADVLRAAREKIAVPERWTQGTFARQKEGNPIGPLEPNAVCWCALGAVIAVAGRSLPALYARATINRMYGGDFAWFNDTSTTHHADILAVFDRAIAAEEQAP